MTAPSNANTSGLEEIISDDEILRVHGHANFGSGMTPRDVVNEGVLKYAFGYCSGHTQLCILMEHGLITKPRPGRYDASLTKKGKRYARALGGYQNAVTAASAQARIAELEALVASIRRAQRDVVRAEIEQEGYAPISDANDRATAAEARADRLAKALERIEGYEWPVIVGHDVQTSVGQATGAVYENKFPIARETALSAFNQVKAIARAALQQDIQP